MKRLDLARVTSILLGLLALAYILVLLGKVQPRDRMTSANLGDSGTSILRELLTQRGYRVRVEPSPRPRLAKDELAVVFVSLEAAGRAGRDEEGGDGRGGDGRGGASLLAFGGRGAPLLAFVRAPESGDDKTRTLANGYTGETVPVAVSSGTPGVLSDGAPGATTVFLADDAPVAVLAPDPENGGLPVAVMAHGELALNGRIAKAQNAGVALALVSALAPRGGKVVLWEGAGSAASGLLESLGPWAFAVRNQALLALLAAGLLMGSRFGLSPRSRPVQVGAREQADALGNLLRRWRGPAVGIEAAVEQGRRRLVRARRLPASAPREQWPKYLAPPTLAAFEDADLWASQKAGTSEALSTIARLNDAVDAELAGRR